MPRFSTTKRSYMASDRSHAHLTRLHSTTHGEVSRPPLLWIGNRAWIRLKSIVAAATIHNIIMKLACMGNLPGRSFVYKCDTDTSNIGPSPILAQCKVHCPWALFREGTVLYVTCHIYTPLISSRSHWGRCVRTCSCLWAAVTLSPPSSPTGSQQPTETALHQLPYPPASLQPVDSRGRGRERESGERRGREGGRGVGAEGRS